MPIAGVSVARIGVAASPPPSAAASVAAMTVELVAGSTTAPASPRGASELEGGGTGGGRGG